MKRNATSNIWKHANGKRLGTFSLWSDKYAVLHKPINDNVVTAVTIYKSVILQHVIIYYSEPSYDLDCVKMKIEVHESVEENDIVWLTHDCNDTGTMYPICEYPYYPANYSMEQNQGII